MFKPRVTERILGGNVKLHLLLIAIFALELIA